MGREGDKKDGGRRRDLSTGVRRRGRKKVEVRKKKVRRRRR